MADIDWDKISKAGEDAARFQKQLSGVVYLGEQAGIVASMRQAIRDTQSRLETARAEEIAANEALVKARNDAADIMATARRGATKIENDGKDRKAKVEAEVDDLIQRRTALAQEVEDLTKRRDDTRSQIKALVADMNKSAG